MATADEIAALKASGLTWNEIAQRTGGTYNSVRNKWRRAQGDKLIIDDGLYYPSARDINDMGAWEDYLKFASRRDKMLKIAFFADPHFNDQSDQAIALARRIRQYVKPHVDFFLGDEFDFDTVSTHWARSEHRKRVDAFHEVRPNWFGFQDALDDDYTSEQRVMLGGNHTRGRVEAFINENAAALPDTIIEAFINLARAGNRVKWMGWTDETWIGHYHIEHGTRYGEMSAKNSLKDAGWSSPRTGGHVHAPSEAWNYTYTRGSKLTEPKRHIVQSITLPCLCNIIPAYAGDKKKARWMNGMGIAYVNLNGMDVHQHKIVFHTRDNGDMVAAYGAETFVMSQREAKARAA